MKIRRSFANLIFAVGLLLFSSLLFAETQSEIGNQPLQNKGIFPSKQQQQQEADPFSVLKEPGFYSVQLSENNSAVGDAVMSAVTSAIISGILKEVPKYQNTLWLQFSCGDSQMLIPIPYKFKNIKWHFEKGDRYKVRGGETQTDPNGKFWISFVSEDSISKETIKLEVGSESREVSLLNGPYEIILPLEACRNK